jgi:transcriptional regulator of acetoin/glycerol metabolism
MVIQADHEIEEHFAEIPGCCRNFLIEGSPQVCLPAGRTHPSVEKRPRPLRGFDKPDSRRRRFLWIKNEPAGENAARQRVEMATEGTNGIGTCLVEQRPMTIDRAQHFFDRNTAMSCIGAPLFDHEGELVGVLDISSCRTDLTGGFLLLLRNSVADAAYRIEGENFARAYADFRVILGNGKAGAGPELFAVDKDDLLIGATRRARKTYGLSRDSFKKLRLIRDVLEGTRSAPDLDAAERAELRRALAHANGNATQAARDLRISRASRYRRMARLSVR